MAFIPTCYPQGLRVEPDPVVGADAQIMTHDPAGVEVDRGDTVIVPGGDKGLRTAIIPGQPLIRIIAVPVDLALAILIVVDAVIGEFEQRRS